MITRQWVLAALLAACACPAFAQNQYAPEPYVLYGWGQAGDGYGYGFQRRYLSQRDHKVFTKRQADTEPWGRYDNGVPGYDSHGRRFSHPYYGITPLEQRVFYVGLAPERGRHNATRVYDRFGKPQYIEE